MSPLLDVLDLLFVGICKLSLLCFVNCTSCMCLFSRSFFRLIFLDAPLVCFSSIGVDSILQRYMLHVQELWVVVIFC